MITVPQPVVEPVDEQQALLVERLRAAGGQAVSFQELRSIGIENPASVCYELEAVGVEIGRVYRHGANGRALPVGVYLPAHRTAPPPTAPAGRVGAARIAAAAWVASASRRVRGAQGSSGGGVRGFLSDHQVSVWLVIAATALVLFITGISVSHRSGTHHGSSAGTRAASGSASGARGQLLAGAAHSGGAHRRRASGAAGAASAAAAAAAQAQGTPGGVAQLETAGHQLLGEERYGDAIGELRAALAASGQSVESCSGEPTSEACQAYASALYDLGRALRLDGQASAAVPVLADRMRIDNQRQAVQAELNLATHQAHPNGGRVGHRSSPRAKAPAVPPPPPPPAATPTEPTETGPPSTPSRRPPAPAPTHSTPPAPSPTGGVAAPAEGG